MYEHFYTGTKGTFCTSGEEIIDQTLCKNAADEAGKGFKVSSWPVKNGVPYGCWHFTGSSTYSYNTNVEGSKNGAWNNDVTPVCRRGMFYILIFLIT